MKQLNVTELDFDNIKQSIKDYYMRVESPFQDYDFEGSGLNLLLDVLAYNTHYNAVLAHLAANESFISSAQLRKNVVARAKTLGYIPHSTSASNTTIRLSSVDPSIISIPRGTIFSSTDSITGKTYSFINTEEIGDPTTPFKIYQGSLKTRYFKFDSTLDKQTFEIPDQNVDIDHIIITSYINENSTQKESYFRFTELSDVDSSSPIYFIAENPNGKYEISFGDNVIGKKPQALSTIEISYLVTDGAEANSLSVFIPSDPFFNGKPKPRVNVASSTSGGGSRESIESIRSNAPLNYLAQNRAVTVDDYKALVRNSINTGAVSVWGGEENNPPEFGKVFISVKPSSGRFLSNEEKAYLLPILDKKGVVGIRPRFVDPDYTYLYFDIFAKYNSSITNKTEAGISTVIRDGIGKFNEAYLSDFEGVFRYSQFLSYIVNLDPALISSYVRVKAYKLFTALVVRSVSYSIDFNFALENPDDPTQSLISSSAMVIGGVTQYFGDESSTIDGVRNIYRYTVSNGLRVVLQRNVGTVNYNTGVVTISDFDIDTDTQVAIFARPRSNDIAPSHNQILEINNSRLTSITSEIDTIAVAGPYGATNYNTVPRE